jgi:hypothetical protein
LELTPSFIPLFTFTSYLLIKVEGKMFLFLLGCLGLSFAEEPTASITVLAHRELELYVSPIQIRNEATEIEAVIGEYSVFGFASMHSRHALAWNGQGGYAPVKLVFPKGFMVYNEDTIDYAWGDNCNYRLNAKKCSYQNNHYLLETHVTVDKHQVVVEMFLYNPELQIVARGEKTSNLKTTWVKQQEVNTDTTVYPQQQQQMDCSVVPCITQNQQPSQTIAISKPKEELPLKWEIPHKLLNSHVEQASLSLWIGAKIDAKD